MFDVRNYKSVKFGNSAKIERGEGRAYKGAPLTTEYSLACYADYDRGKLYHFSVYETFEEAYNKLMTLSCGDWKEV